MTRGTKRHARAWRALLAPGLAAVALGALGAGGAGATTHASASKTPIVIGADLSLSGDFSSEGIPFAKGYKLWADYVNAHGGLLGRQVKLIVLSDASSQAQLLANYEKLISVDHANLLFGPVSTLFTVPAAQVAKRFGYALVEGAGGGPLVFNSGLTNVFYTGQPIANGAVPFAKWIASLPAKVRPKTVAYATSTDPFAEPQIAPVKKVLSAAGLKTVYNNVFPVEVADYNPVADAIAASGAQVVILGAGDLPTLSPFIHAFVQQGYNPRIIYTTGGADQGPLFTQTVGAGNVNGIAIAGGWWPGYDDKLSHQLVSMYLAKYGGKAANIDSTIAESFSVGEVVQQAVEATKGLDNRAIMAYLHSGATTQTVLGPVSFNKLGQNTKATAFIFQWQGGQFREVLPKEKGGVSVLYPKPAWGS